LLLAIGSWLLARTSAQAGDAIRSLKISNQQSAVSRKKAQHGAPTVDLGFTMKGSTKKDSTVLSQDSGS
jgi:hypothetical protein